MAGNEPPQHMVLIRSLSVPAAVMLGLGSILGTGVFVAMGLAAGIAGSWALLAIGLAAAVATANALSSAQLAAAHPVSGGTYEYGYRLISPTVGFGAGWLFLVAKSSSAAAAAIGLGGYVSVWIDGSGELGAWVWTLGAIGVTTTAACVGMKRTAALNTAIVSVTVVSLVAFVGAVVLAVVGEDAGATRAAEPFAQTDTSVAGFLHAAALIFVAFTGYGRIATLGEEVRNPRRTLPIAIIVTLGVAAVLYIATAWATLHVVGPTELASITGQTAAPLEVIAQRLDRPWLAHLMAVGAATAMLGVLLNLLLGLSRVLLAMGRRGDLPRPLAQLSGPNATPVQATLLVAGAITLISLAASFESAWSLSAMTVLIYYATTNLAALRLSPADRFYPRWIAWTGLIACVALAAMVPARTWLIGSVLLAVGLLVRLTCRALGSSPPSEG